MPPSLTKQNRDYRVFLSSVFFVLGFSIVFALVGVLLQTVFSRAPLSAEVWFGRVGGVVIILFGLFLLDLITPAFLERTHTFAVKKKFANSYVTSFVFGAAFAVGWTPCVSAALGAILALAATQASSAFLLLVAYTIGIGLPFLVVGFFTSQAQAFINRAGKWLNYFQYFFGAVLIVVGVFIFTGDLNGLANSVILTNILTTLHLTTTAGGSITSLTLVNIGIAFLAGLGSFLSPCILPIIPGFLSYLASTAVKKGTTNN
jgi:cytochrome c-type biogenesis protein